MSPPSEPAARRPRAARAGGRPRAFTLIELLISLALLSIVLGLIYTAFGQISGPALALRDELNERQDLRLLVRMIADDLQSSQWLERFAEKGAQFRTGIVAATEIEEGKEFTHIAMHTVGPARFHREFDPARDPRLHEVGYRVQLSEDRERLELVRREDFYLDDDLERDGLEVVLMDGMEAFLVEFLPPQTEGGTGQETWEKRWDSPNRPAASRMPLAIRVTVTRRGPKALEYTESLEFNLPGSLKL